MKNLKLLAASIVAGSLLSSASQAAKIEGIYLNAGIGRGGFHGASLFSPNTTTIDTYALSYLLGAEYIYNYIGIIASLDLNFRYIDFSIGSKANEMDKAQFEMAYLGLGKAQFLGRFNLGYELVDGFALLINVGMTAQGADKSENLVKGKKLLSNIGFIWGFGARYALSKNWSVRGDLGFNSVSMTKDANGIKRKIVVAAANQATALGAPLNVLDTTDTLGDLRKKTLQYVTSSITISYNF